MSAAAVRAFGGPRLYLQGPGALREIGPVVAGIARAAALVADAAMLALHGPAVLAALRGAGVAAGGAALRGEVSDAGVAELDAALPAEAGCVIGLGGGRAIDAAKAVALRRGVPVVTVPTAASNDSPTSRIFVMYRDDGALDRVERLPRSPEAVLVDTEILLRAPPVLLRAGIGDGITKRFEAEACAAVDGITPFGTPPLRTGAAIAMHGFATLLRHAPQAMADVAAGRLTEDFEATVEAVILMSGLGFENGGLSIAHSLTRGFTRHPGSAHRPHGEQVAFGLLVQLHLAGEEAMLRQLLPFHARVGLPRRLAEIGLSAGDRAGLERIAEATLTAPHAGHLPGPRLTVAALRDAMLAVDALARSTDAPPNAQEHA
ncbi:glycerol dehydrogenase [Roseomonas sp. OT10]|uniref:glycerol dehydrogenase n=1 Tax=Roseomonas cutis TaxID=2897332 RepID=UPI001E5EA067|nr:glycerol dehydrogenase [Roseomonas sp. OT10]UFN48401.1 glycerol dehydrogenase [Roseomonas sp. OT10]